MSINLNSTSIKAMKIPYSVLSIGFIIVGFLLIAVASIAVECYNKNTQMYTDKKGNFDFSATMVAFGFIVTAFGLLATYQNFF